MYRLNKVQLVTTSYGSPVCKMCYLESYALLEINDSSHWSRLDLIPDLTSFNRRFSFQTES